MAKNRKRKHSALFYVRSISTQVWNHPANRGRRVRALGWAAWWQLRKRLVRRPAIIHLPRGVRIYCYPDNTVASQVWYFGSYTEYGELLFMTRLLRPGDKVIDAGANIGLYSLLAAPIVGPDGRVDCFEPATLAADRLAENVGLNGFEHVHLHRVAVSDRQSEVAFSTGWDVSNSMIPGQTTSSDAVTVMATTLDDAICGRGYVYAKLDLEGAEGLALKGARRLLATQNPPVWQCEVYNHMLRRFGSTAAEVVSQFREHGYILASYDAATNVLAPIQDVGASTNLLAIAEGFWGEVVARLGARV